MRAHAEVKAERGKPARQGAPVTEQLHRQAELGQVLRRAGVQPALGLEQPERMVQRATKGNSSTEKPRYALADKPFNAAELEKQFSKKELEWIKDVFKVEEVVRMFAKFKGVPVAVLHRVEKAADGSAGEAREREIAITDIAYSSRQSQYGSDEVRFKSTLIHELTHFLLRQVRQEIANTLLPEDLVTALRLPEEAGFPRYAFGWFEHPTSGYYLHFDLPEVCGMNASFNICNPVTEKHRELLAIKNEGKYEHSPLPKSGDNISAREDLAESFALYLSSPDSRKFMEARYPLRLKLLDNYFAHLKK